MIRCLRHPFPLSLNTLIIMSTTTAVIYARVSSVGDRQNTDRQISDLLDYVEYQKLELCKIYEEHISGAKKNSERPVLQQAIEFCKANQISILLVSELSRLGRNAFEVLATVKGLIDSGVDSIGINVPLVSETNVPLIAERNVPLVSD